MHDADVAILVDVKWTSWRPHRHQPGEADPWRNHAALLRELLGDGSGPVDGWIIYRPEMSELRRLLDGDAHRERDTDPSVVGAQSILQWVRWRMQLHAGLSGGRDGPDLNGERWHSTRQAQRILSTVVHGLWKCSSLMDRRALRSPALTTALLNLFACRVYLDPRHLHRLTGGRNELGIVAHACVDFRFEYHLGRYWLYAHLSVWSRTPRSRAYTPFPAAGHRPERGVRQLRPQTELIGRDFVERISKPFSRTLERNFPPITLTVLGQFHRPPRFWVVSGGGAADAYDDVDTLSAFGAALLGARAVESDVAGGALTTRGRSLRVLRRFLPDEGAPCYLVVPDPKLDPETLEAAGNRVVVNLATLETEVAATLFDLTTDLEMDRCLISVYNAVAWKASVLWDQLAMFLPDAKGKNTINAIHRLIQLVHLVLLQGIADLDAVQASVREAASKIDSVADKILTNFDARFTEEAGAGSGVRAGLRESGYVARSAAEARSICEYADRVRGMYQSLLDGIGDAFDERRVRHTDKVGELAILIGVAVGGLGMVSEAFGNVLRYFGFDHSLSLRVFLALIVLFGTGIILCVRNWSRTVGQVADDAFAPVYSRMRTFLLACRTDLLERNWERALETVRKDLTDPRRPADAAWTKYYEEWNVLDARLAEEMCAQLDALDEADGTDESEGGHAASRLPLECEDAADQLNEVKDAIERWTLVAMLASERPRRLSRFPLPRLTLLYRFHPLLRRELHSLDGPTELVISDTDLFLTLRVHCSARREDLAVVKAWGERAGDRVERRELTAGGMLDHMTRLGVAAGLTPAGWSAVCADMRTQFR